MISKVRIYRMGWRDALEIVQSGGYISKYDDGHAEVIGPVIESGIYTGGTGGCCEGYLTARSVELLEAALAGAGEGQ